MSIEEKPGATVTAISVLGLMQGVHSPCLRVIG